MAYIDNADIILRVTNDTAVQLTSETGSVVDTTVLDDVRESAEAEVESYLSVRYYVPVDVSGDTKLARLLKDVTLHLAIYKLYSRRPIKVPETVEKARDDTIKWLVRVTQGRVLLPATVTPASTTSNDPGQGSGGQAPNLSTLRDSL